MFQHISKSIKNTAATLRIFSLRCSRRRHKLFGIVWKCGQTRSYILLTIYLLTVIISFLLPQQNSDGSNKWGKTVLEIDTREKSRLPIVDVSAYDIGGKNQDFKIEIGPACFHYL